MDSEIVIALIQSKGEGKQKKEESIEDKLISKKDIQPKDYEVSLLKIKLENDGKSSIIILIDEF